MEKRYNKILEIISEHKKDHINDPFYRDDKSNDGALQEHFLNSNINKREAKIEIFQNTIITFDHDGFIVTGNYLKDIKQNINKIDKKHSLKKINYKIGPKKDHRVRFMSLLIGNKFSFIERVIHFQTNKRLCMLGRDFINFTDKTGLKEIDFRLIPEFHKFITIKVFLAH